MRYHVRAVAAIAGTVLAATAATACSGSTHHSASSAGMSTPSASASAGSTYAPEEAAQAASPTVSTKKVSEGTILVNEKNMTLYLFQADKTSTSTCTGACAVQWPPLVVKSAPSAGSGVQSKLLSTSKRSGGGMQVTYKGHPLYRFEGDQKAGQTNGQGLNAFGAKWYVVGTDGKPILSGGASSSSSSAGGGGGY